MHTVVLHLGVHEGIAYRFDLTLGLAMAARKAKRPMQPKPLKPMVAGMSIDAHGDRHSPAAATAYCSGLLNHLLDLEGTHEP